MDKVEEKNKFVNLSSESNIVLVTGATSTIGHLVVDELLRTGVHVRALTHRPEKAVLPPDVEVMAGDFNVPASLDLALEGVTAVFLVWTIGVATAADVIARLAAYPSSQPRRIVYLASPHKTQHPFFQQPNPMRDLQAEIERLLAATQLDVAIIRPGMFASNVLHWWSQQIRSGDVVRWPYAAAETAPIDVLDIAAVATRVLLDKRHAQGDFVLTGSESLSQTEQVQLIGDAIGKPLRLEELSPDEFRRITDGIWPSIVVEMLLSAWHATLGYPAFVTSDVHKILGRPPRTFYQWATDHAAAFSG
jgi:uncharacterized protein YbjT (DUF2867 family)